MIFLGSEKCNTVQNKREAMIKKSSFLSITLSPDLARELDLTAKREKRSRSELVREAVRQYVLAAKWRNLRQKAALKAAKQGWREEDIERLVDGWKLGEIH
jgi:CopG family transcriptional regulator/antitoxin EndoAI